MVEGLLTWRVQGSTMRPLYTQSCEGPNENELTAFRVYDMSNEYTRVCCVLELIGGTTT